MSASSHDSTFPAAVASATRDAWTLWLKDNSAGEDPQTAYALFVRRIEINASIAPGARGFIAVEVVDRRPGRSTLTAYSLSMKGGQSKLTRQG